jgi:hypothetical protein
MPRPAERELLITIVHEAGHAVMAADLGLPVKRVTVRPGPGELGCCTVLYPTGPSRERERIEKELLVCLAGPVAAQIYSREPDSGTGDHEAAFKLAMRLSDSIGEAEALVQLMEARVRWRFGGRTTWARVEAVAEALDEREELTGAEVGRILRPLDRMAVPTHWFASGES